MTRLSKQYNKTLEHISELYVKLSGDLESIEKHLQGKEVILWTTLEDYSLTKDKNSFEYTFLLDEKGGEAELQK